MRAVDFFTRDVHSFWATSYEFDLKLFDQFLLRRLGNLPLNAVVLSDPDSVSEALGGLGDIDRHVAANANRRYLLRGIRPPSGGRFHPKTYLFASRAATRLLVGSGNLTRTGLDRGKETFVAYDAAVPDELVVLRGWATWMRQLVAEQDDPILRGRFDRLLAAAPPLLGPAGDGPFATNDSRSLLDQLVERAPDDVQELHVCAPFFDERAQALAELIRATAPSRGIHLYIGDRTSVDGQELEAVLAGAGCPVYLHGLDPSGFVHAKLVGLVGADASGLLMCGSANLSQAALTRVQSKAGSAANSEAVVFRSGDADSVRAAFVPPDHTLVDLPGDWLAQLEYAAEVPRQLAWPVRLRRAALTDDDHIVVKADGDLDGCSVTWDEAPAALALSAQGRTTEPLAPDSDPRVLWLIGADGQRCSNPVALDDPEALEAVLGEANTTHDHDRPDELRGESGSELVRLLTWAHRRFIFDLDDTPALRRANNAQEHQQDAEDSDFWERYVKEELISDPRSQTYRPLGGSGSLSDEDLLLLEIKAMLEASPRDRRLRLIPDHRDVDPSDEGSGAPWSLGAREQLRARNLLRRWAHALADPRHAWVSPVAPALNYEALLEVLALVWHGDGLDVEVTIDLLGEVWTSLLGGNGQRGLVDRADPELAGEVLDAIGDDVCELAAGLAFSALYGDLPWARWIYAWQPFLVSGIERGLFAAGPLACDLVEALRGVRPTETELEELLLQRSQWTDDDTWGQRMSEELGAAAVKFVPKAGFKNVRTVVRVDGLDAPSADPRLIVLARRSIAFKRTDHVLIQAGDERYLIRLGQPCTARLNARTRTSVAPIDGERLMAIERQHGTLADLLGPDLAA